MVASPSHESRSEPPPEGATSAETIRIAPPPPTRRTQPRRAWRALRGLIADPERTDLVFEVVQALAGRTGEKLFQRFAADPVGRALLVERPSLLATLSELDALEGLPEGSFGRAYAAFMRASELRPEGLLAAAMEVREDDDLLDPDRRYFYDRLRDSHDLWHVLTGYGRDLAGEAANLAFTVGQTGNRGLAAIVLSAAWLGPRARNLFWQRYLLRAWRRGRHARALTRVRYEDLLPRSLDDVRRELGIEPPEQAHPGGVLTFDGDPRAAAAAG